MNGYIKLHRKMLGWGWYHDVNTKIVFLHLLLSARFEKGEWRGHVLLPGQVVIGRKKLAETLGISEQSVRTAIDHLISTNEITIESTKRFSVVTIENWEKYQCGDQSLTNETTNTSTNSQPTGNQQVTNSQPQRKNVKNDKNVKKERNIGRCAKAQADQPDKLTFGEFQKVKLTLEEYERLAERLGTEARDDYIERLDMYLENNKRKKYNSHYATILSWARKDQPAKQASAQAMPRNVVAFENQRGYGKGEREALFEELD